MQAISLQVRNENFLDTLPTYNNQEELILEFIKANQGDLSGVTAWDFFTQQNEMPITSVRRALTMLAHRALIEAVGKRYYPKRPSTVYFVKNYNLFH